MIYATPVQVQEDGESICSGQSTDSGFKTFDEITNVMPDDPVLETGGMLIYGGDIDRVMFTKLRFVL